MKTIFAALALITTSYAMAAPPQTALPFSLTLPPSYKHLGTDRIDGKSGDCFLNVFTNTSLEGSPLQIELVKQVGPIETLNAEAIFLHKSGHQTLIENPRSCEGLSTPPAVSYSTTADGGKTARIQCQHLTWFGYDQSDVSISVNASGALTAISVKSISAGARGIGDTEVSCSF